MVKAYLGQVHREVIKDTWRALSVDTGERAIIAILLGGIYLAIVWNLFRDGGGYTNLWLKIAASFAPLVPYPAVYCWKFSKAAVTLRNELRKDRTQMQLHQARRTSRSRTIVTAHELSVMTLSITDVIFDPKGLTEFYIAFNIFNSGIPSNINNVCVSATYEGKRIIDKLAPRLTFAPLIQDARGQLIDGKNPSLALLESGEDRDMIFTFTYEGNAKQALSNSGTRFFLVGFDRGDREISSEFTIP